MRQNNPVMNLHPVPASNILIVVNENLPGSPTNNSIYLKLVPEDKYPHWGRVLNRYYLDNSFMKKIGLPDRYSRMIKRVITNGEVMSETIIYQRVV